ncbi:MAG TPA: DUF2336 domain-containing protein [Microvirga sp.]|jgi:hypothetical protein
MLDRLIGLSKDSSATGRRELLNAVTDLFLVEPAPTEIVKEHYSDIAVQALNQVTERDRADYATRVAAEKTLPRTIATTLAADPAAAVASVVLRLSPVLTDADLAAVAVTHSAQHLLAIAQRTSLSETVTDVLVQRGDRAVLRTVSGNDGARFSQRGMTGLLDRSEGDETIVENLVRRSHQLTPDQAIRLQRIADQVGSAPPADGLAGAKPFTMERRQAQERRLEVKLLIADVQRGLKTVSDVIELLANDDRAFDLAQVVSVFAGIPNVQCLKVLLEPDVSGIAVACRSIGLTPAAFRSVLQLRAARLNQSGRQVEQDAQTYTTLPGEVAERTMRFLQVRSKVGATSH